MLKPKFDVIARINPNQGIMYITFSFVVTEEIRDMLQSQINYEAIDLCFNAPNRACCLWHPVMFDAEDIAKEVKSVFRSKFPEDRIYVHIGDYTT